MFRVCPPPGTYSLSLHDALPILLENVLKTRLEGGPPATLRARLRHADGAWIHVEIVAANRFANPAINGLVLNIRDIRDRKSTRLNSSHMSISYAVFCLKKKNATI